MTQPPDAAALRRQWGARLRAARHDKGLTQNALAELAEIDQANVSRVEAGRAGLDATLRVAHALGLTLEDLAA
jgi:transcriptional regulator with XRE-family HTH domain